MSTGLDLSDGMKVTGAAHMWTRIVRNAIDQVRFVVPPGSRVVEVGYGDGLITCWLAKNLGWRITGMDMDQDAHATATRNAIEHGVKDKLDLRLVGTDETWKHTGEYDAVFIKTVLYNARNLDEYARWLDWVVGVLKPGGMFVNFENGNANRLTYVYRKIRRRYYTNLCMYDSSVEALYRARFPEINVSYYGAVSQFVAPIGSLYHAMAAIEENVLSRNADNSFIAAIVARKQ